MIFVDMWVNRTEHNNGCLVIHRIPALYPVLANFYKKFEILRFVRQDDRRFVVFFARFGRNMGEMSIEGSCYRRINVDRLKFSYLLESTVITTTVFTTVYTGTGR